MNIPKEVLQIAQILKAAEHQAYLVGGCLRDLLMDREPNDWDIATDALPAQIQELFPDSVYENEFGTVAVKTESEDLKLKLIEITTFREEEGYSNQRHPDSVQFTSEIEADLSRRDFTINSLALSLAKEEKIIDPFEGQRDLNNKVIRSVRDPHERFGEDALRLMRAVRLAAQLDFEIEEGTELAIKKNAHLLEKISKERIRIELEKLILSPRAAKGIESMQRLGLLKYVIPELEEGLDMEQNMHHIYSVFEHNLKSLEYAAKEGYPLEIRLAALLHDVGKPKSRRWKSDERGQKEKEGDKGDWTFYGHQVVGGRMAEKILSRLTFPKKVIDKVSKLVYEHMFVYDPDIVTLSGVRRLLSRIGEENVDALMQLRQADRIGSGVPKAQPYRLRHLMAMIEKVKTDPISVKMLKINGEDLNKDLNIPPGPLYGQILDILLAEVLEDPKSNKKKHLLSRAQDLAGLKTEELDKLRNQSRQNAEQAQESIDNEIKKKYFVQWN